MCVTFGSFPAYTSCGRHTAHPRHPPPRRGPGRPPGEEASISLTDAHLKGSNRGCGSIRPHVEHNMTATAPGTPSCGCRRLKQVVDRSTARKIGEDYGLERQGHGDCT